MKRFLVLVAVLVPMIAGACGQPQVVAEVLLDDGQGERRALGDLPIRLLPYDRDAIFDSLEAAYPEPEPAVPPALAQARRQVQEAQAQWRDAEERWASARDELRRISDQLRQMEGQGLRGTPQYRQLFERFGTLENQERQAQQQMNQAFARFDAMQQQTIQEADSVRIQQDLWAEQAFAGFNQAVTQKLRESGREELADTTNAQGIARFRAPRGRWWLYARYTLPFEELYWNIPLEISDDSTHVTLTRENAQARPIL